MVGCWLGSALGSNSRVGYLQVGVLPHSPTLSPCHCGVAHYISTACLAPFSTLFSKPPPPCLLLLSSRCLRIFSNLGAFGKDREITTLPRSAIFFQGLNSSFRFALSSSQQPSIEGRESNHRLTV